MSRLLETETVIKIQIRETETKERLRGKFVSISKEFPKWGCIRASFYLGHFRAVTLSYHFLKLIRGILRWTDLRNLLLRILYVIEMQYVKLSSV